MPSFSSNPLVLASTYSSSLLSLSLRLHPLSPSLPPSSLSLPFHILPPLSHSPFIPSLLSLTPPPSPPSLPPSSLSLPLHPLSLSLPPSSLSLSFHPLPSLAHYPSIPFPPPSFPQYQKQAGVDQNTRIKTLEGRVSQLSSQNKQLEHK